MARTVNEKQKSQKDPSDNETEDSPSLSDRAQSGMKIAGHLRKAVEGGSLRKGFSLWRVARELPTAASGAGELFKRHPVPIALLGGALTTAGLLVLAHTIGAFDSEGQAEAEEQDQEEGREEEDGGEEDQGEERE